MRSEERAGVVAAILLFLWGTLLTEPFHIFTGYIFNVLTAIEGKVGIGDKSFAFGFITSLLMALLCVLLLILSRFKIACYIPCGAFCFAGIVLLVKTISSRTFYVGEAVAIFVALALIAICHATSLEKVLLWISDFTILSIPMFLLTGLVCKPLAKLGKVISKILYINKGQKVDISSCFKGVFGLPALLWGLVLFVLLVLPIIYQCLSKRRT